MNFFIYIDRSGRIITNFCQAVHSALTLLICSVQAVLSPRDRGGGFPVSETLRQIYFSGTEALLPVGLMALGIGVAVGFYSNSDLLVMGGSQMLSLLFLQIGIQFFGPIMISLLVIARSGTAVASELGSMKVSYELDALRLLCRDPTSFLIFPRIVGGLIGILSLGTVFTIVLVTAFCLSVSFANGASALYFFEEVAAPWTIGSVLLLIAKYAASAGLIFTISCRQGLSVERSSYEVPKVTSRAVLQSIYAVFFLHLLFAALSKVSFMPGAGI